MPRARAVLLCVLASCAALGGGPALAQAPAKQTPVLVKDCKKCRAQGRLACPEHPKSECELEDEVLYCSAFIDCAVCRGAGFVVCPVCQDPTAAAALEKRRADRLVRQLALKTYEEGMKRPLRIVESDHTVFVWEIDRLKVEKKLLNAHELNHLYARRMETVYADYLARMEIDDKAFVEKVRYFVWDFVEDQELGSTRFCGQGSSGPIKRMGNQPAVSLCGNKRFFQNDETLHRSMVHYAAHLLLSAQDPIEWVGNQKAGWLDEGIAHWFEDRYFGVCDTYCFQETNDNVDFKGGKFRLSVREMVTEGDTPPIAEVFEQNIDTLSLPQHAASFSYVDYLITRDAAKFNALIKRIKAKVATRDAMKEVYGYSPLDFEAQWKAWVLATYPTR